jgi:hypothetical protein
MDDMIKEMLEKGLISIEKQRTGKVDTYPPNSELFKLDDLLTQHESWWGMRAYVIAHDKSTDPYDYSMESRLLMRKN